MNGDREARITTHGELVPFSALEIPPPQSAINAASGDSDDAPSQAVPLYVDPSFRSDRAEPGYGPAYWIVGLLALVGLLIGALAWTRGEQAVTIATRASLPIPHENPSQTLLPLVPNIENSAPAVDDRAEPAAGNAAATLRAQSLPPPSQPPAPRQRVRQVHLRVATQAAPLAMHNDGPPIDAADLPPLGPEAGPSARQPGD